eukprot:CAMPEP_0173419376 /NCGR_PEP_ID=MMETSP1357-20121228/1247_1 /TAXON_ID=77926 /ORGANISM="Hemiselmis rufescens, Strain PCC563" /LENGTH=185 /DNA_ID=CAMNT_0014382013 /DNA_START=30 /DNA_END=587 /DNA_ORIENTATION=-
MSQAEAWFVINRLFKVVDKQRRGYLDLDQLVDFVAEVKKMDIVAVDEAFIVQRLQDSEAEQITLEQFKDWSCGPDGFVDEVEHDTKDPFGNSSLVPKRFVDAEVFRSNVKVQHPCYTTTGHDIGIKRPSQVDMPVKWRGKEGVFTTDFVMSEPGKMAVTINNYTNRGLRTNKTYSKVHKEFDIDF